MRAIEQYFPVVLFIILNKIADKTTKRDYSVESYEKHHFSLLLLIVLFSLLKPQLKLWLFS